MQKQKNRKIIGISLDVQMAKEVKREAAARGISLKSLFCEMWADYLAKKK